MGGCRDRFSSSSSPSSSPTFHLLPLSLPRYTPLPHLVLPSLYSLPRSLSLSLTRTESERERSLQAHLIILPLETQAVLMKTKCRKKLFLFSQLPHTHFYILLSPHLPPPLRFTLKIFFMFLFIPCFRRTLKIWSHSSASGSDKRVSFVSLNAIVQTLCLSDPLNVSLLSCIFRRTAF